jgi:hypothetical protein
VISEAVDTLQIQCMGEVVPFVVEVSGFPAADERLLTDLVEPYWTVTHTLAIGSRIAIDISENPIPVTDDIVSITKDWFYHQTRATLILHSRASGLELALTLIDAVRIIFKIAVIRRYSGINCHAGAATQDGRAALFSCARGSGKTTILRACAAYGFQLLANDQCVLVSEDHAGPRIRVIGFPALVAVRPDSAALNFQLPPCPLVVSPDAQDGIARRRYSLPQLAAANKTSCVPTADASLFLSYEQAKSSGVLKATPVEPQDWLTDATYELLDIYDPNFVELARSLPAMKLLPKSQRPALRFTKHQRHYRVTCSSDMVTNLPAKVMELLNL